MERGNDKGKESTKTERYMGTSFPSMWKKLWDGKWVFSIKYKTDGSIKDISQIGDQGFPNMWDFYQESFCSKNYHYYLLISCVVNLGWALNQLYVTNASLLGDLKEQV